MRDKHHPAIIRVTELTLRNGVKFSGVFRGVPETSLNNGLKKIEYEAERTIVDPHDPAPEHACQYFTIQFQPCLSGTDSVAK
jgi:hypothetical protein